MGVFFLIGGQVLGTQDFGKVLEQLGWYFRCGHNMAYNIYYLCIEKLIW